LIEIAFWVVLALMMHTYLFFPFILKVLSRKKKYEHQQLYTQNDLPSVSIVMAAHNEEKVIGHKLKSIFNSSYPKDKIEILIGSDCSTDLTNEFIASFEGKGIDLKCIPYTERQGKAKIINALSRKAKSEILVLTDANVFFTDDTLFHLVKHFKTPEISIVGGNIRNPIHKQDGISFQEKFYLSNENILKHREGLLWGSMIGAFGGCYAIRKNLYSPVPRNYFMDDFYISMHVLKGGGKCINELDAVCDEDVSNLLKEEFRRKIRISIGNFQNLETYISLLKPKYGAVAFSFLSHKVLRWLGPFILLDLFWMNAYLASKSTVYLYLFALQSFMYLVPLIDYLLRKIQIHIIILRFITHFISMNGALLIGFFKYLKGVETNVWQPTKRNQ